MIEKADIGIWIEKICSSRVFTSPTDARLLRFLVNSTLEGLVLKETVIAVEIFNRDPSYNPGDDSIVRSSIYNLRKKLDTYYLDEGKSDKIRVTIPKGSYQVVFEEVKDDLTPGKNKVFTNRIKTSGTLFVILFIAALLFIYFIIFPKNNKSTEFNIGDNYLWSGIMTSEKPLLIVLGDYFMMERIQPGDSSHSFVRIPEVNNPEDFINYRDKNPEIRDQMKAFGMSYFGEEIPWGLLKILEVFKGSSRMINVKYSSELTPGDMRGNDIIFFGDFSTLNILKSFLTHTHYRYNLTPPTVFYSENYTDTTETIFITNPLASDFQNDYAVVSKIRGYEGNIILLFLSFSPFGKTEAVNKLTDPSFPEELKKISAGEPDYWDMLLKVSGLGTSGFYYEILRFESIRTEP